MEEGKRLYSANRRKRELKKSEVLDSSQYYSIGVLLAVGVIDGLGYNVYQAKVNNVVPHQQASPQQPPPQQCPMANKFEME